MATLGVSAQTIVPVTPRVNPVMASPAEGHVSIGTFAPAAAPAQQLRAPQSRSGEEMTMPFSLAGNPYTALYLNGQSAGNEVWQAFEMDEATVKQFAGNRITAISFYTPANTYSLNPIREATVFLTYDLEEEPFYTQKATLGTNGHALASVPLDTPYELEEGKPVYCGYIITLNSAAAGGTVSYIVIDYVPTNNLSGGWVKASFNGGEPEWANIAQNYGSLCISADVTGSNLPTNTATPVDMALPASVTSGKPFDIEFVVTNDAANDIYSFEVEYTVSGKTSSVRFTSSQGIGYKQSVQGTIKNVTTDVTGVNLAATMKITKVNDEPNVNADAEITDLFNSLAAGQGYDRNVVIEEGTGTWCQFCPLGIPLMEYAREKYADGSLIPIAMHNGDEMAINSYQSVIQAYLTGFPSYIANRDVYYQSGFGTTLDQNKGILEEIYSDLRSQKAVAKIDVEAVYTDENKTSAKVYTDTQFALANNAGFRIAVVLTEDGVGPYDQTNGLAGNSSYVGYEEYVRGSRYVSVVFNDVARFISNAGGVPYSVPVNAETGKTYDYDYTLNLSGVKPENCHVIALLINSKTGEIENAAMTTISEPGGVGSAVADGGAQVTVTGMSGAIAFSGDYKGAGVYNASGALVATASGEASVAVPAGLYIVRTAGGQVAKVAVR